MIHYRLGNLLDSEAEALVNTVNTVGVMGKGIALQMKKRFPQNFKVYAEACKAGVFGIGQLLITEEQPMYEPKKTIINFPTKQHWRAPAEYAYIEAGLEELVKEITARGLKSVAIPPLGAGNGGLDWNKVKALLAKYLSPLDCEIFIYEPNAVIKETLAKERVKLTPARAMLLSVLYDLVRNGEFVSEFAAEKIAYFLQRFGAGETFKLAFQPNFYGPYSGKVRHVLYYLNGSYITGYSAKDKGPFEELDLVMEAEAEVAAFLEKGENTPYKKVVAQTINFLEGFYSPFGLELLSTVDYIMTEKKVTEGEAIAQELQNWSNRKKTLYTNPKFLKVARENIQAHLCRQEG